MSKGKIQSGGAAQLVAKTKVASAIKMKRYGNLYNNIISKENLLLAHERAKKGKTWQKDVQNVDSDLDFYINKLHDQLKSNSYKTSKYKVKTIYEPKKREIYILPYFPDRIAQHAIMNILEPIWDALFINASYACRKGKGQHKGSKVCMKYVKRNTYCLKCDCSKFYPSINHDILKIIVRNKIKCRQTLNLLDEIIDSIGGNTNAPIGNYLSQWFGNLYLNELDMLIKHKFKIKDYVRYCDDFLLFSNDKNLLNKMKIIIRDFLASKLNLKMSKCDLFPTTQGVDFLGYRHFPSGCILLRKSTAKRVKRRIKAIPWKVKHGIIKKENAISVIESTKGWMKWANTHNLSIAIKLKEIKKEIDKY